MIFKGIVPLINTEIL